MLLLEMKKKIKTYLVYYIVIALFIGGGYYMYANMKGQKYTATAVIQFETTDGTAPDGTEIDTDEITSSEVISNAVSSLGDAISADQIREGISVDPIVDEKEEALYEAKLDHGEEYDIINTKYKVTFSCDASNGKDYPRRVLNAVLQAYFTYYGTYHSSVNLATNSIKDIDYRGYDYLETVDTLNESIDEAMDLLAKRMDQNSEYRSTLTGYSFQDIYNEFNYIRNEESPNISAEILSNRVSKDADVLITTYKKKNTDIETQNSVEKDKIKKIEVIIDNYVNMMKQSGNASIEMDEKTLQAVFDSQGSQAWNNSADKTTEYDDLLTNYVNAETGYSTNEIEYAYNKYVIDTFSKGETAGEVEQEAVEGKIREMADQVNNLLKLFNDTNDEYNEYLGAKNLSMLTNVSVSESINVKQYTLMVTFAALLIEIVLTAVKIRANEIINVEAREESKGLDEDDDDDEVVKSSKSNQEPEVIKVDQNSLNDYRVAEEGNKEMLEKYKNELKRLELESKHLEETIYGKNTESAGGRT